MLGRMRVTSVVLVGGLAAIMVSSSAEAQDSVRYYQQDGVTYREVRNVVKRPVVETKLQSQTRTVYREQVSTQYQPTTRTVHTPVTNYYWQARWHDVLNPFRPATVGYHLVPHTQWQSHTEIVDTPITRRQVVPQTEIVDVPVTTRRYVDEEIVRRTVVNSVPGGAAVANRTSVGGISQIENDPPRRSTDWQPATVNR